MKHLVLILALLLPTLTSAQDVPVSQDDLKAFLQLAKDAKCRAETQPKVTADSLSIVTDRMGRVYGSGTGNVPFTVHMDWCNYQLDAKSSIQYSAAMRVEPDWGFRFRMKAATGMLLTEPLSTSFGRSLDVGAMIEPFYYKDWNLNAMVGLRSLGAGIGLDLTKNVTAYLGYGLVWGSWRSSPFLGVGFSLW